MFVGVFEEQGGIPGLWDENVRKIKEERSEGKCGQGRGGRM